MKLIKVNAFLLLLALIVQSCASDNAEKDDHINTIAVQTLEIGMQDVPKKFHFTGTVVSLKQSMLSTRLMGQVAKVHVNIGKYVSEGELLISIRSNDLQAKKKQVEANILQAKAAHKHASDDYKRVQALYERKSATQKELDDITVHYQMAKAQLEIALKAKEEIVEMLSYANIKAPFSGVVTQKFVDVGDMANPGMPLLAVESPGLFEVNTRIPESDVYIVEKGDQVEVRVGTFDEVVNGVVDRISPSSRLSGSHYEAVISLRPNDEQEKKLRSGMFAHVDLFKGKEKKILLDQKQLVDRGQLTGVWVVSQNNEALLRWVRLGKTYGNKIEVLSGLNEGIKLIVKADERLHDGALLKLN